MSSRLEALKAEHPDFLQRRNWTVNNGMQPMIHGEWVSYEDAAALVAALGEVETSRDAWADSWELADKDREDLRAQLAASEAAREREFREHEVHRNWQQQELSKALASLHRQAQRQGGEVKG